MQRMLRRGSAGQKFLCALVAFLHLYAGVITALRHTDTVGRTAGDATVIAQPMPASPAERECIPCTLAASLVSPAAAAERVPAGVIERRPEVPVSERSPSRLFPLVRTSRGPPVC